MTVSSGPVTTRDRMRAYAVPFASALGRLGFTPNSLTVIGFVGTCAAAYAAADQRWLIAGILVLVFGLFDMLDGALARSTGRATRFGAFLDSTLDRTGESLVLAGVAVGFAVAAFPLGVIAAVLAGVFASGVTYTRARAEGLGVDAEVGIAPRPVRLALLGGAMVLTGLAEAPLVPTPTPSVGCMGPCDAGSWPILFVSLGLIALLSAITVVQRIVHVRSRLGDQDTTKE
jgi:CDP-diacylglycerol--glycerol-3-phosphate 3-phosphatidyltransferase